MNYKKLGIATVAVAVAWLAMDFVIHSILLMGQYEATPQLWRPVEEMSPVNSIIFLLVFSLVFVLFYMNTVASKNVKSGIRFGMWYGLAGGLAMAGHYNYMPITLLLAGCWFLAILVESVVAGAITGWACKD